LACNNAKIVGAQDHLSSYGKEETPPQMLGAGSYCQNQSHSNRKEKEKLDPGNDACKKRAKLSGSLQKT